MIDPNKVTGIVGIVIGLIIAAFGLNARRKAGRTAADDKLKADKQKIGGLDNQGLADDLEARVKGRPQTKQ